MKIDVHTHIMPKKMPNWSKKFAYGDFLHLEHDPKCNCGNMIKGGNFFRRVEANCWDGEVRMKECEDHGIDVQVLSTIPVLFNYWAKPEHALETSRFLNDHIAETVSDNPNKFIGLGTIPMQSADVAINEMQRIKDKYSLPGIEIGTHVNGKNLNHKDLFPIFKAAEEMNMAIFAHPWDMLAADRMTEYWSPWLVGMPAETTLAITSLIFGGVLEKLPNLKIMFAHGGGSYAGTLARIEHGFNVRPDIVAVDNKVNPRDYFGKIYFDSLTHDPTMLKYLVELAGSKFVALGTDYPFPLGELAPGQIIDSIKDFDDETRQNLLWRTALDWLGLDYDFYQNI